MSKSRTFFRSLFLSLTSPKYYKEILVAKPGFSLKFFFMVQLLLSIVTTVRVMVPIATFNFTQFAQQAVQIYPTDLEISVNKGKLSINQPLPYSIPMPKPFQVSNTHGNVDSLVLFESDANVAGVRDVLDRKALVVVTETSVYARKDSTSSEVRSYPIPADADAFAMDGETFQGLANQVISHPFFAQRMYVPAIAGALFLVILPMLISTRYTTALLYAVFAYFAISFLKLSKEPLKYKQVLRVSFHSLTLVFLLAYVADLLGMGQYVQGFWFLAIYLGWTLYVVREACKAASPANTVVK